jgi:type VII secretion integral membrane protein EccD
VNGVQSGIQLTRLVVLAPKRRLDLAVPEQLPLVSLLPGLIRRAGEDLADEGLAHDGWVLRRPDGSVLDPAATFVAQQVRDGETLHLVPRRLEWPEPTYDDVVDAIASGARARGRRWDGGATRMAGITAAVLALGVAAIAVGSAGPPWTVPATAAAGVAGGLLVAGIVLSRAMRDSRAGAVVAAAGLAFAALGGVLFFADGSLRDIGAPHLLTGSVLAVVAGVLGYVGTAEYGRLFIAGVTCGGCGAIGSAVALTRYDGPEAAALLAGLLLLVSPLLPAVAVRVGHVPLPQLPRTPEDLVRDDPVPDARSVAAATARADETLTGLLWGLVLTSAVCFAVLAWDGDLTALLLVTVVALAHLLRGRFYVAVRHRVPLLLTGASGLVVLGLATSVGSGSALSVVLPAAVGAAGLAVASALVYSDRLPAPRMGRLADIGDVLLTLAVVPLVSGVFGLFGYVRGLLG